MVLFGHKSTVSVTFDEVMMMARAIDRGSQYGLRMVDMPYWSFHISPMQAVENAGRFSIMCEVTSEEVCQYLTENLPVPVISLGAGNKAHGVHIIGSDLFHLYEEHVPRHSKIYTDLIPIMEDVYNSYMADVRN